MNVVVRPVVRHQGVVAAAEHVAGEVAAEPDDAEHAPPVEAAQRLGRWSPVSGRCPENSPLPGVNAASSCAFQNCLGGDDRARHVGGDRARSTRRPRPRCAPTACDVAEAGRGRRRRRRARTVDLAAASDAADADLVRLGRGRRDAAEPDGRRPGRRPARSTAVPGWRRRTPVAGRRPTDCGSLAARRGDFGVEPAPSPPGPRAGGERERDAATERARRRCCARGRRSRPRSRPARTTVVVSSSRPGQSARCGRTRSGRQSCVTGAPYDSNSRPSTNSDRGRGEALRHRREGDRADRGEVVVDPDGAEEVGQAARRDHVVVVVGDRVGGEVVDRRDVGDVMGSEHGRTPSTGRGRGRGRRTSG